VLFTGRATLAPEENGVTSAGFFIDDLGYAAEITAARFRQRSWFQRMAHRGAHLITRLL
jgi:hypothetical protein